MANTSKHSALQITKNYFLELGLDNKAAPQDVLQAVMSKIRADPKKMKEIAEAQAVLLNSKTRFIIELLYFPDFESVIK